MDKNFYSRLKEILPADQIKEEEPMRLHTTFRVGGPARFFVTPKTAEELQGIIACCREAQVPFWCRIRDMRAWSSRSSRR